MCVLHAIAGDAKPKSRGVYAQGVVDAVRAAQDSGYRIGSRVLLGRVEGTVIGYNIARTGRFAGTGYPVIVETSLGIAKCSATELRLAA